MSKQVKFLGKKIQFTACGAVSENELSKGNSVLVVIDCDRMDSFFEVEYGAKKWRQAISEAWEVMDNTQIYGHFTNGLVAISAIEKILRSWKLFHQNVSNSRKMTNSESDKTIDFLEKLDIENY
jgi:hypothetical protein